MAIQPIGSNNPTTLDSSLQPKTVMHPGKAYDATKSSLVSLSMPQQEGIFSSLWDGTVWLVKLPFRPFIYVWNWATGATGEESVDETDEVDGTGGGAPGVEKKDKKPNAAGTALKGSEAITKLLEVFGTDVEFDGDAFKKAYTGSGIRDQFRKMIDVANDFEVKDGKDEPASAALVKKKTFDGDDEEVLKKASEMLRATVRNKTGLTALGTEMTKLANDLLENIKKDDDESDLTKKVDEVNKKFDNLAPPHVKWRLNQLVEWLTPDEAAFKARLSKKEGEKEDERFAVAEMRAKGQAMLMLASNAHLAITNEEATDELAAMLGRVVGTPQARKGDKNQPLINQFLVDFNKNLGPVAKKALTEAVSCRLGIPGKGEAYIKGTMKVNNHVVQTNYNELLFPLIALVYFSKGLQGLPEDYQNNDYFKGVHAKVLTGKKVTRPDGGGERKPAGTVQKIVDLLNNEQVVTPVQRQDINPDNEKDIKWLKKLVTDRMVVTEKILSSGIAKFLEGLQQAGGVNDDDDDDQGAFAKVKQNVGIVLNAMPEDMKKTIASDGCTAADINGYLRAKFEEATIAIDENNFNDAATPLINQLIANCKQQYPQNV